MKKSLLFLVVFALLWGGVATVQAAIYSGECGADGANVTWKLDTETGKLEISGTGAMADFKSYDKIPWLVYSSVIDSVTIGNEITTIGNGAFSACTNFTSITIPNSVITIGDSAFAGCRALTYLTIGNSVTSIGNRAFYGCTMLKSNVLQGHGVLVTNEITIPNSVTTIGNGAFACTSFRSITIPNSVITIGDSAFAGCRALTNLTIGNSVTSIGNRAFYGCTMLKSNNDLIQSGHGILGIKRNEITIPNSVTTIGDEVFSDCTSLVSVIIGDGVTSIGGWTFDGCTGLTSVTIGKNVANIGDGAFYGCTGLTSVTIPNSVTAIDSLAFCDCTSLTNLRIEDSAETLEFTDCSEKYMPFVGCPLDTVYLGRNISYDGDYSPFTDKTTLVSLTIGKQVTAIGGWAFSGCKRLSSVTIPESVQTIGTHAFYGCCAFSGLNKVYISDLAAWCRIDFKDSYSNPLSEAHNLYLDNTLVTDLKIPDGVTEIYPYAFSRCTSLKSVTIPEGVTAIGSLAFYDCTSLVSVAIPNSVTSIDNVFNNCTGLKKVYISDLAAWSRIVFKDYFSNPLYYAHNLYLDNTLVTYLKIPDGVTEIYPYAFYGCTSLASVTIPNSVTSIGGDAFFGCSGLRSVTIGSRVATIGKYAFYGCTNLRTITAQSATPPSIIGYSWSAFDNDTYKYATVYCPKGTLRIYKNADGWKNFTYPTAEKVLNPKFINGTAGQTIYSFTFSYTRDIDYPVSKFYILTEGKEYLIDMDTTKSSIPVTLTDLEPQTEYKNIEFVIETVYGEKAAVSVTFTTDTVRFTTQPAINVSNTSATLTADIECDALTGAGFEWRRYDDPELVPSTFSETPIVDGKISGTLRNLSPEKYYKYRPFYRTAKGKYYYGAWLAFGTRDIYAYFEPTVSTRTGEVRGNTTTLSGYIVEGSDEIISQGFEYWAESPAGSTTAGEHKRVEGSGSLMNVTLTGLDYNTTYYYRAYATTAKKTTYGAIESFTTGENPNPSGIEETAAEDGFAVRLSGNPVRNGEIGVQVVGADGATWYRVISLHGAQIAQGVLSGTDEWQPVKIPAASTGHYLLQIIGSKGTKTLRIVVE